MSKLNFSILGLLILFTYHLESSAQNARIQVVHNAANAPAVDIFVGATKLFANVPFRTASPFSNAPAGVELQVRIKAAGPTNDTSNPAFFRRYTLEANKGYYLVANGNLNLPNGSYAPNPDGIANGFDVTVIPDAKETADVASNVELRIMHSVTDAPTVDVKAQGVATLVNDAPFRGFSSYIPVPAANYTVQISPASGSPNLLAYKAPLTGFAGNTLLVLASGYFNPAANTTGGTPGPGFGLVAFAPTGGAGILLPTATSRVQIVHNSAGAPNVDIFVNGAKAVPGLAFRTATPFVSLNAGVPLTVAIKGASASTDTSSPAFKRVYELAGDESYTLVATGLLSTTGFASNPEGRNLEFDITVLPGARENSSSASTDNNAEIRILHGATDAPRVDVRVAGGTTIVNNAGFRDFTPYLSVPNQNLVVEVTDSNQTGVVAAYSAPLSFFGDSAIVVIASGFLSPAANQNGPAFGLLAVTAKGNAILLPPFTSVASTFEKDGFMVYPNPSEGRFSVLVPGERRITEAKAISADGKQHNLQVIQNGNRIEIASNLSAGLYSLQLTSSNGVLTRGKIVIN